jgi:hypothetical protein
MNIHILGACGGIGTQARTMSLLVDRDILIDANSGVGDLMLTKLRAIDHVFLDPFDPRSPDHRGQVFELKYN